MSFHKRANSVCTILTTVLSNPIGYGRIVRNKEGKVLRIVEDREANPKEKNITEINSGIYAANSNLLLEMLKRIKPDNKKGEYYLTDAVGMLVDNNLRVETFLCKEPMEVFGINSREDIAILGSWLKGKILQEKMSKGVTIIDPRFTYIEANVTIGTDTIIFPFTVIERDVVIGSHCEIGPFSHIRPGTVIEDYAEIGNFVEVKKSRIGFRSKAKHLSYLGDAIIGKDVNIGAGTITANFDGVKKHTTIIEDGAFTGCNTVLVAPVKMGKYSKTGAGAVVPKGKDVRNGDVVVGIPARSLNKKKR
jgi:bifunctional UDP-N-acetylglucosamine pyrophosphorylase/glucosamine-1-phosphate N-acetyltransferase